MIHLLLIISFKTIINEFLDTTVGQRRVTPIPAAPVALTTLGSANICSSSQKTK